jgi:hypothetical protein
MTNTTTTKKARLPRTTSAAAVRKVVKNYIIDTDTGRVFNKEGYEVGGSTYEPRITVHLGDKKYNARVNKIVGYLMFGPDALKKNVQIRHRNGDKFDNRGSNLEMIRVTRSRRRVAA